MENDFSIKLKLKIPAVSVLMSTCFTKFFFVVIFF